MYTRVGTLGRNYVRGPGYRKDDLGVQKNFQIIEGKILELHGDAFNITNTANFNFPDTNMGDTNFGKITALRTGSSRQIQLSARFVF